MQHSYLSQTGAPSGHRDQKLQRVTESCTSASGPFEILTPMALRTSHERQKSSSLVEYCCHTPNINSHFAMRKFQSRPRSPRVHINDCALFQYVGIWIF